MAGGHTRHIVLTTFAIGMLSMTACVPTEFTSEEIENLEIGDLRALAEEGNAAGQVELGERYRDGLGVEVNDAEALKWMRLAADQGEVGGQIELGLMYSRGTGIQRDFVRAHMWTSLAASQLSGTRREEAIQTLDALFDVMTSTQITEAEHLAREWAAAHPREP
jgi:TPR repeat protein